MKKYIKYLLLCSLCMIIGEGLYLSSVSDSYQVENIVKAYDLNFDNENQCFKSNENPNISGLKPVVLYQYKKDGVYVDYLATSGEAYVCDNPETLIITPVIPNCDFDGWYLDEALTQKVTGNKVGDVLREVTFLADTNGCLIGIDYITKLYASCKEEVVCTENYDKTFNVNYYVDGKVEKSSKINAGSNADLSALKKEGYTFDGWYLDKEFKTKATKIDAKEVKDAKNCITGYEDVAVYGKFVKTTGEGEVIPEPEKPETPEPENPETSDNIFIFIGLGFVLLLGSGVVIKKLANK